MTRSVRSADASRPDHGRLPHAYPFRFVDTLERSGSDRRIGREDLPWQGRVLARVSSDGWAASGGAWASPVLLIEALAQAALLLEGGDSEAGRRGFLAGIDGFELLRSPEPGESLSIEVGVTARFGSIVKFEGEVRSAEEVLARGAFLVRRGEGGETGRE